MQTDNVIITSTAQVLDPYNRQQETREEEVSTLTAADLASILKWSKDISSDMSLSLALQRLTEIATGVLLFLSIIKHDSRLTEIRRKFW